MSELRKTIFLFLLLAMNAICMYADNELPPRDSKPIEFVQAPNWGWDGNGNGYFTEGVFKSNSPYDLDDGVSSSSNSNNYSYEVGIIANIRR